MLRVPQLTAEKAQSPVLNVGMVWPGSNHIPSCISLDLNESSPRVSHGPYQIGLGLIGSHGSSVVFSLLGPLPRCGTPQGAMGQTHVDSHT